MSSTLKAITTLVLCLGLGLARAQDSEPYEPDPPDRAARLSFIQGDVSLQPAGEEEWAAAIVNRPLTTGDKLWTAQGARAEIYVGQAAIRLGNDTGFSFLNVDDDTIQMRMTAGVINVSVRALDGNDHIEIDTPNVALSLLRPGNYRVEVNDAGDATTVKISEGEAQATGSSQDVIVHAQQVAMFKGVDEVTAQWSTLGAPDEFDSWNLERDRRDDLAATSRTAEYVSPDVTGYEDLEGNGSWSSEPEYGNVWTPSRVAVGWAPYQFGRWVWVAPWGWTWIDDAPWGYAPFHYGRWAHVRQRWCWVPGPRHVRAVYAPALVGWAGSGVGVSWFPLGPREVYVPGRRFSHRYVERVNVSNTWIVNRAYLDEVYRHRGANVDYRNRRVAGAVTGVLRTKFASGGRVSDHRVRVDGPDFNGARIAASPQVAPVRESRLGGAARLNTRAPPQAVANRQVVVHRNPPPSAARFTRSTLANAETWQAPAERHARPADRNPQDRDTRSPGMRGDADNRDRADRPPRVDRQVDRQVDRPRDRSVDRPVMDSVPRAQPPVSVQRPSTERTYEDRPSTSRVPVERHQQTTMQQQMREQIQQRVREQQSREQPPPQHPQERERIQRQPDIDRQPPARQTEQRERNTERPRQEQPRQEQPRVERPRPEPQKPVKSDPPRQNNHRDEPRAQRN